MKIIKQKQIEDIFRKPLKKTRPKEEAQEKIKILVDHREKNSFVPSELLKLKQNIEFRELKVGDYIINNIAIERKTIQDFTKSMIDKRLFKQLEELKQFPSHLIIIEGKTEDFELSGINPNAIKGFLLTINLKYQVPTIFTQDPEETAQYLKILANKKEKVISFQISKRNLTKNERAQFILEAFPNIGPKKSRALLEKFYTLENIFNSSEEEVKEILGKQSKEFLEIIKREFKD